MTEENQQADEEILEEPEISLEQLNESVHAFRKLKESPAFQTLDRVMTEQIELREKQILTKPLEDLGDLLELLRLRGERHGIAIARLLPDTLLDNLETAREEINDEPTEE
jgi:hypothetical protein